jgi:hypothetical protein
MTAHVEYTWVFPNLHKPGDMLREDVQWSTMWEVNARDVMNGRQEIFQHPPDSFYPVKFVRKSEFEVDGKLYTVWDHCKFHHMSFISVVIPGLVLVLQKPRITSAGVTLTFDYALSGDPFKVVTVETSRKWTCGQVMQHLRAQHGVRSFIKTVAPGSHTPIAGNQLLWSPVWLHRKPPKPTRRVSIKTPYLQTTIDSYFNKCK